MEFMHVEALVLAAGYSSRMKGKNKLLLEVSGKPVIEHVLSNIFSSEIKNVTVVVGNEKDKLLSLLQKYPVKVAENKDFARGMSSSIKHGIAGLPDSTRAAIIFLGDMPLIRPQTINKVLVQYRKKAGSIIAPVYEGRRGHPVLFDQRFFPGMLELSGDVGAGSILNAHYRDFSPVEVDDPGILIDVDRPEDFFKVKSFLK